MNLEDTIYVMCAAYSCIFPNRRAALNHLFCTGGNGYEWKDGELITKNWDFSNPDKPKQIIYTNKEDEIAAIFSQRKIEAAYRTDRDKEQDKRIKEILGPEKWKSFKAKQDYQNRYDYVIPENIKWRVRDTSIKPIDGLTWYPIDRDSNLYKFPKNIKPDWLEAIIETCNLIIKDPGPINKWADPNQLVRIAKEAEVKALEHSIGVINRGN